ncbi:MAG: terminase small subunit [Candidatus Binataceae bacterium]
MAKRNSQSADRGGSRVLDKRERRFVLNYVNYGMSALAAAVAAGYSEKSAAKASYDLVRRPHVAAEIERRQAMLEARGDMSAVELYNWSVYAATCDWTSIFEPGTWTPKPMNQWDPRIRRLVESVEIKPGEFGETIKIKFSRRTPHLDRVQRMLGFRDNVGVENKDGNRSISIEALNKLTAELGPIDEFLKARIAAINERRATKRIPRLKKSLKPKPRKPSKSDHFSDR